MSAIHQLGLDLKANLRIRYTLLIASCKSASCQVNCKPPSLQLSLAKAEWSGNKKPRKRRFRALINKVTAYTQVCAKIFCSCVQFQVVQSRLLALKYSLTPIPTIHPTPSLTPPFGTCDRHNSRASEICREDIDWGESHTCSKARYTSSMVPAGSSSSSSSKLPTLLISSLSSVSAPASSTFSFVAYFETYSDSC